MDWVQRLLALASLNYFLNAVFNKKGRNIHSTETGRILIQALPDIATQPDMTAHWESQLTDISQKQATYQQFMHNLNQMLPDLVRFVDLNALRQLSRIKMIKSDRAKPKSAVKNPVNQTVKLIKVKPINIFLCKALARKLNFL